MHESGEVWEHGMHTVPNSQMLVPIPMGVAPRERSSSPDPAALVKSQRTTQRSAPPPRSPSPEPGCLPFQPPPPPSCGGTFRGCVVLRTVVRTLRTLTAIVPLPEPILKVEKKKVQRSAPPPAPDPPAPEPVAPEPVEKIVYRDKLVEVPRERIVTQTVRAVHGRQARRRAAACVGTG